MDTYNSLTYSIGKMSRYIRDKNKNCFDTVFTFYNKTCDNISKGYNNQIIIKENTYINEDTLNEPLVKPEVDLRRSLGEISKD